jgi:ATP-binding cassette, subfamily B, bacterial PglK
MVMVFISATLIAGIIRLLLLYTLTRFSFSIGSDLSIEIYRRTLYQEYLVHISRNSSEIINGVISKTNAVISGVLNPIMTLISSIILIIFIVSALLFIDVVAALTVLIGFAFIYLTIVRVTKEKLKDNSFCISKQSTQMLKAIQEGLGGIRDVLINGNQEFYCELYKNSDLPLRRALGNNSFINGAPRYIVESIGMIVIALLAYNMILRSDSVNVVIPVLGALALGAQRLLPALQQSFSAYSSIKGAHSSFSDVLHLLNQPLPTHINHSWPSLVSFKKEIELKNLGFYYKDSSTWIFKNINITIVKGSRVGFIGATGCGKSTLIDVIMALIPPSSGTLSVDGKNIDSSNKKAWQAHIAHVSQNTYLSDSTIEENIAFGISKDKINHQRVKKVAQQAQISELIEQWKDGYQTFVGERGVRISGGQRQRIGIARALYKKADVLIFDEATSALDNETETKVMKAIEDLSEKGVTVLIIAHRLSTLQFCDKIVKLDSNHVIYTGTYKEIINAE